MRFDTLVTKNAIAGITRRHTNVSRKAMYEIRKGINTSQIDIVIGQHLRHHSSAYFRFRSGYETHLHRQRLNFEGPQTGRLSCAHRLRSCVPAWQSGWMHQMSRASRQTTGSLYFLRFVAAARLLLRVQRLLQRVAMVGPRTANLLRAPVPGPAGSG